MKTSYFGRANSNAFKNSGIRFVSVARSCRYWSGEKYPALFPTYEMIKMTDEKEYEEVYRKQVLDKLDPLDVYRDLEDAVILCHESIAKIEAGETFCHRHIIAKWLEEELWLQYGMDVKIPELRDEKADLKKVLKANKNAKKHSNEVNGQLGFSDMDWD